MTFDGRKVSAIVDSESSDGPRPAFTGALAQLVAASGVALHDLQTPAQVIGVGDSWILQPEDPWETTGYVHNVVFTCGAVPSRMGTAKIHCGGAENVTCVGEAKVSDLVELCIQHGRPPK